MQDYGAMIRSTFELGSVRDAELLFETIVKNSRTPPIWKAEAGTTFLRSKRASWTTSPSGRSTATASPWAKPRTSRCTWTI